jgi:hypothetical protein
MAENRRRVPRRAFGGVAEITTAESSAYIVASTAELSRYGCFVNTQLSLPVGTKVSLKITYEDKVFNASGEVAYVLSENGLGIRFTTTAPEDVALLEEWLRQQTKF